MTTDQELDAALHGLLREPAMTRTGGLQHALATIETTPQQSHRWWPLRDKSGPSPPRRLTMFSAVKFVAAAAIVALFGGFLLAGVPMTPQGEEPLPAAVTASPSPEMTYQAPHPVSGTLDWEARLQTPIITQGDDRKMYRGEGNEYIIEMNDPRLSGTMYQLRNRDDIGERYQHADGEVWTGSLELVNDAGAWSGTVRGYTSMNPGTLYWHIELTGSGAHEGSSALLSAVGLYGAWDVDGFIFPGALPAYPEPVEVPTE